MVEKRREVPNALQLLPLVPADGLPSEPDRGRPCRVLVISTSPGVKPLVLGVVGEWLLGLREGGGGRGVGVGG